jgi:hypothetical protein
MSSRPLLQRMMPLTRLELFLNDIGCYEMQRHIKG